jgi:hypothetical protein
MSPHFCVLAYGVVLFGFFGGGTKYQISLSAYVLTISEYLRADVRSIHRNIAIFVKHDMNLTSLAQSEWPLPTGGHVSMLTLHLACCGTLVCPAILSTACRGASGAGDLRSSDMLRSLGWQLVTDVAGQPT